MKRMGKIAAALIAACTLFSGASVAVADEAAAPSPNIEQQAAPTANGQQVDGNVTVSNVKVSDIGAHTASISFDYAIDPSLMSQIKSVCFATSLTKITQATATETVPPTGSAFLPDVTCSGGTSDDELTQDAYERIYGFHDNPVTLGDKSYGTVTEQNFYRYYADSWDGKANGTFNMPLIGLADNATYGNTEDTTWGMNWPDGLGRTALRKASDGGKLNVRTAVDVRQLYAGLHIELQNGDVVPLGSNAKPVPDFTTTAEPSSKPTAPDLTEQNKGKVTVPNGTVNAGSVARIYVENLAKEYAAKVDAGENCFWYSYIYSDPVRLTGPDGSPYVTIQKDDAGKYYYDVFIPADYTGAHKIALQDDKGTIQGWTDVTVNEKAPTTADKTALNKAIEDASKLVKTDYTETTWTPFASALDAAKAVAAKADATPAEVDAATKALTDAQGALKKASTTPGKDDTTPDKKPETNNKPNKADSKKKPAAKQSLSNTGVSIAAVVVVMVALTAAGVTIAIRRRA